jgi:hypothetical protein
MLLFRAAIGGFETVPRDQHMDNDMVGGGGKNLSGDKNFTWGSMPPTGYRWSYISNKIAATCNKI